jgi:hypothetical protein
VKRAVVVVSAAVILFTGYVAGVNAPWVSNAVYVSRVTGAPLMQVVAPFSRHWLATALEPLSIPKVNPDDENQDDEELSRAVESERG